mgnify:CR=1 FL=1
MRSPGFALLTAALLLGSGGIAAVAGPAPPPPAALPLAEGIREPFFSLLVGFVESDLHGAVPGARLRAEAARLGRPTRLPLERIAQFRRDVDCRAVAGGRDKEVRPFPFDFQFLP